jgi:hypothetical protein
VEELSWDAESLQRDDASLEAWTRELVELGETLKPTTVVRGFGEDANHQLLVQELPQPEQAMRPPGEHVDLGRRQASGNHDWRASTGAGASLPSWATRHSRARTPSLKAARQAAWIGSAPTLGEPRQR